MSDTTAPARRPLLGDGILAQALRGILDSKAATLAAIACLALVAVAIFVHVLKTILIPIVTVVGMEFGSLIAFATVTETIFAWPGVGKLIIDSIMRLDRPVIVAYLLIVVAMFIVINLVVDILYSVLDPRVRLSDA